MKDERPEMAARPLGDVVRAGYDALAEAYLAHRSEAFVERPWVERFEARLPTPGRVLDLGCGAGVPIARYLADRHEVLGLDFSANQVALARRLVPRATFKQDDMTVLDLPPASFDGVICWYAIIHVPRHHHRAILANIRRALRPSGAALLCMGAGDNPEERAPTFMGHPVPMAWSHFGPEANLAMIREAGLEVVESEIVADRPPHQGAHLFVIARA